MRNRARELVELLSDVEKIRAERRKAKANKNKYVGTGNDGMGFGSMGFESSGGGRYGGFGGDSLNSTYGNGGSMIRLYFFYLLSPDCWSIVQVVAVVAVLAVAHLSATIVVNTKSTMLARTKCHIHHLDQIRFVIRHGSHPLLPPLSHYHHNLRLICWVA